MLHSILLPVLNCKNNSSSFHGSACRTTKYCFHYRNNQKMQIKWNYFYCLWIRHNTSNHNYYSPLIYILSFYVQLKTFLGTRFILQKAHITFLVLKKIYDFYSILITVFLMNEWSAFRILVGLILYEHVLFCSNVLIMQNRQIVDTLSNLLLLG